MKIIKKRSENNREVLIRPARKGVVFNISEIIEARFMLWNMIKRNIKIPYVDLSFGVIWVLFKPIIFVLVVVFIKQRSGSNMQEQLEYVLFLFVGLISYWYFSEAVNSATKSIYKEAGLITKVYYPRIITPIVPVIASTTDFFIQLSLIPIGMYFYSHFPGWNIFLFPLVMLHFMLLSLALGYIASALSIESRDYMSVMEYILYVGFFLSPVLYSYHMLPSEYHNLYFIMNPVAAPIEVMRSSLFDGISVPWVYWSYSILSMFFLLIIGIYLFKRMETYMAERVI